MTQADDAYNAWVRQRFGNLPDVPRLPGIENPFAKIPHYHDMGLSDLLNGIVYAIDMTLIWGSGYADERTQRIARITSGVKGSIEKLVEHVIEGRVDEFKGEAGALTSQLCELAIPFDEDRIVGATYARGLRDLAGVLRDMTQLPSTGTTNPDRVKQVRLDYLKQIGQALDVINLSSAHSMAYYERNRDRISK